MLTDEERTKLFEMVDKVEAEVGGLIKSLGSSREWSIAITKMEECAMWMRRAVERS